MLQNVTKCKQKRSNFHIPISIASKYSDSVSELVNDSCDKQEELSSLAMASSLGGWGGRGWGVVPDADPSCK